MRWILRLLPCVLLLPCAAGATIKNAMGPSIEALAYYSRDIGMYTVAQRGASSCFALETVLKGHPLDRLEVQPDRLPTTNGDFLLFLPEPEPGETKIVPSFISLKTPSFDWYPATTMTFQVMTSGDSVLALVKRWAAKRHDRCFGGPVWLPVPVTSPLCRTLPDFGNWIGVPPTPELRDSLLATVRSATGADRARAMDQLIQGYPCETFQDLLYGMLSDTGHVEYDGIEYYPARQYAVSRIKRLQVSPPSWYHPDFGKGLDLSFVARFWPACPSDSLVKVEDLKGRLPPRRW